MTSMELLELLGQIDEKYIQEARGDMWNDEVFTSASERVIAYKRRVPLKRKLVIALVAALMLMLVGCAVLWMKLQDLKVGDWSYEHPGIPGVVEEHTITKELISMQGFVGSSNYQAAKEWNDFLDSYDVWGAATNPENEAYQQSEEAMEYMAYQCYSREMQEKIDEICDKYGLEVLGPVYTEKYAIDVVKAVGIDNLFADTANVPTSLYEGYYYRGGTFQLSGETTLNYEDSPWIYPIAYQYRCVMKNAFDEVPLPVDALEDFDEWNYCLGDGTKVLLALSAEQALVIVDKEEYFVTINVLETSVGDVLYGEQQMSREGLEAFAETFNFGYEIKRPNPETLVPPEWFADPESGESEFIENNVGEETDYENELAKKVYEYLLLGDRRFLADGEAEKWWIPEFHEWSMTYEYTYLDLDGDGIVELLVQMIDSPGEYNGVFHYEEGQLYCWNSDAMEMSCRDYPLSDGTMVRQLEFGENYSYTIFRYTSDGGREEISYFHAREELLTEDSSEPCPYYEIDGNEVSKSVFDEELKMMIQERMLEKSAWIELVTG